MKHKRQTLGKQSEDGSDKDSQSTKSTKSDKSKSLICEESKKSCQNCDLPPGMLNDHLASRNNFSTNSNASTGMSSADSNSSSFEKMEEDSRSNEGSGALTSPPIKKHDEIVVKLETSAICCSSPKSQQKKPNVLSLKDPSQLMSPDVKTCPVLPPGSLTPSTPSTPVMPMASPLASSPYQSSKSHSPSQSTPAAAFQNQSPPILGPQASRNSTPTTYPSPPLHRPTSECPFKVAQYRGCPSSRDNLYQHQQLHQYPSQQPQQLHRGGYGNMAESGYPRQSAPTRVNGMHATNNNLPKAIVTAATTATTCTTRQSYPCQQFSQQYCGYNGNTGHSELPYQSYQRSNYHSQHYDEYTPSSVNYGSYQNTYSGEHANSNAAFYGAANHQHNYHHHGEYANANMKPHFYDDSYHNNSQHDAPSYGSSPDQYPVPPATNSSVVMTPPSSVRGDSGNEQYNTFHQFYANNATPTQLHNQNMALPTDNSNSSSEFNFLSNLANDFAPEYYQLSWKCESILSPFSGTTFAKLQNLCMKS